MIVCNPRIYARMLHNCAGGARRVPGSTLLYKSDAANSQTKKYGDSLPIVAPPSKGLTRPTDPVSLLGLDPERTKRFDDSELALLLSSLVLDLVTSISEARLNSARLVWVRFGHPRFGGAFEFDACSWNAARVESNSLLGGC